MQLKKIKKKDKVRKSANNVELSGDIPEDPTV